ncbi:hypothetical protein BGZ73_002562 [Actinomortierella ambigua]|nr:hypothetical protein BGZ73_002562 [Actinomortierella ambigua]
MASTLFHTPAKAGSSSANPFLDLAHFYEQEMSDLMIDARLSGSSTNSHGHHHRQQQQSPSAYFRSAKDSPHSISTPSTEYSNFAAPSSIHPTSHMETFPSSSPTSSSTSILHRRWDLQDYAAEARKRSEDRHDGLGPIIDFSSPAIASPMFSLDLPSSASSSSSSSLSSSPLLRPWVSEDHSMHHHNPYAVTTADQGVHSHTSLNHNRYHSHHHSSHSSRATSQWEQVWMDVEKAFQQAGSSSNSPDPAHYHSRDKNTGKAVEGRQHPAILSKDLTSEWEHTWQQKQHPQFASSSIYPSDSKAAFGTMPTRPASPLLPLTNPTTGSCSADVFLDAAAKLPSEWPMAPWAIRTEAALLENEAMHRPLRPSSVYSSSSSSKPLITCGYAIDKRPIKEEYNDDLFEGDMLHGWISTLASEKQQAAAESTLPESASPATVDSKEEQDAAKSADPVILNMALRRLQRLMGQLQVSSPGGENTHPHLMAAAAAASPLNLFCLIDGESTSSAFPVSASTTTTVGELKELLKAEKANDFQDVDAYKLTLWRVNIADSDDIAPIPIDGVPNNEKKKLRATNRDSVFGATLAEDTIHIIVQRPPPVLLHKEASPPTHADGWDWEAGLTEKALVDGQVYLSRLGVSERITALGCICQEVPGDDIFNSLSLAAIKLHDSNIGDMDKLLTPDGTLFPVVRTNKLFIRRAYKDLYDTIFRSFENPNTGAEAQKHIVVIGTAEIGKSTFLVYFAIRALVESDDDNPPTIIFHNKGSKKCYAFELALHPNDLDRAKAVTCGRAEEALRFIEDPMPLMQYFSQAKESLAYRSRLIHRWPSFDHRSYRLE